MLRINFSFDNLATEDSPGFKMGNLEIIGDLGRASSAGRSPDQSMMVVLSIVELLDGIRRLLSTKKQKEYRFIGIDCSFSISFLKVSGKVEIFADNRLIHTSTVASLKRDVESSVIDFMKCNEIASISTNSEVNDLRAAVRDFTAFSVV